MSVKDRPLYSPPADGDGLLQPSWLGLEPGENPRVPYVLRQRLDLPDLPFEEVRATASC